MLSGWFLALVQGLFRVRLLCFRNGLVLVGVAFDLV